MWIVVAAILLHNLDICHSCDCGTHPYLSISICRIYVLYFSSWCNFICHIFPGLFDRNGLHRPLLLSGSVPEVSKSVFTIGYLGQSLPSVRRTTQGYRAKAENNIVEGYWCCWSYQTFPVLVFFIICEQAHFWRSPGTCGVWPSYPLHKHFI